MVDTLPPLLQTHGQPMTPSSGNFPESGACINDPSSFSIGSVGDPNSLSRQDFAHYHHPPLSSDMGLRFITSSVSDDSRFAPAADPIPHSTYSNELKASRSTPSITHSSSFSSAFPPDLQGPSAYEHSDPLFVLPNSATYYPIDFKSHLAYPDHGSSPSYQHSLGSKPFIDSYSSIMAPPSRSPNLQHLNAPHSTRELYTGSTPQLRRASDLLSRSPSASSHSHARAAPISPSSSSGFASPANMENPNSGPPLGMTEHLAQMQTSDGQSIRPEIHGKVDKGFFMADNDWTCYRRNYFQLSCSYSLNPLASIGTLRVHHNGSFHPVHALAVSIAAVVDGRDGRPIDLVQHTPKRDKGPQVKPERVTLAPRPLPAMHGYGSGAGESLGIRSMYDQSYGQNPNNQPNTECTYERIQFKCATANNGRRRAAQQYYHLLVELCADLGASFGEANRWVKVAHRISSPVVVRGRSPGHYQPERRNSNASAGGSTGPNGGSSYDAKSGMMRPMGGQMAVSGTSSMVSGGGYIDAYHETRPHHYSRANIEVPMEPIMSAEEIKAIDETEGYLYYPSPIYEGTGISLPHVRNLNQLTSPHDRNHTMGFQLPTPGHKMKQESYGGYNLPSLTAGSPNDNLGRHFGRFDGLPSSRGFYPTVFATAELGTL